MFSKQTGYCMHVYLHFQLYVYNFTAFKKLSYFDWQPAEPILHVQSKTSDNIWTDARQNQ